MKQQKGATLITVLVILVIVTLLGTIAVKMGIVGLKIATNSQVNALLFLWRLVFCLALQEQSVQMQV